MNPHIPRFASAAADLAGYTWFDATATPEDSTFKSAAIAAGVWYRANLFDRHLPFPKCAVLHSQLNGTVVVAYVVDMGDRVLRVRGYALDDPREPVFTYERDRAPNPVDGVRLFADEGVHAQLERQMPGRDSVDIAGLIVSDVLRWLELLSAGLMSAYVREGHAATVLPLSPTRRALGRLPLLEWRTVVVEPRPPRAEPKGGTHASPRQHDRRGHWRTRGEKRFWVKQCRVGRLIDGMIMKDYKVKGPEDAGSPPPPTNP